MTLVSGPLHTQTKVRRKTLQDNSLGTDIQEKCRYNNVSKLLKSGAMFRRHFHKFLAWSAKSLLFLSAYFPLGIIMSLLLLSQSLWASGIVAFVSFVSLGLLRSFIKDLKKSEPMYLDVEQVQRRDRDIVSYIVTYAIPFLTIPFEGVNVGIGLGIFFVIIWLLQVKLNLLHINPVFALFDYHIYEITASGRVQILLSKNRTVTPGRLELVRGGDHVLFDVHSRP